MLSYVVTTMLGIDAAAPMKYFLRLPCKQGRAHIKQLDGEKNDKNQVQWKQTDSKHKNAQHMLYAQTTVE